MNQSWIWFREKSTFNLFIEILSAVTNLLLISCTDSNEDWQFPTNIIEEAVYITLASWPVKPVKTHHFYTSGDFKALQNIFKIRSTWLWVRPTAGSLDEASHWTWGFVIYFKARVFTRVPYREFDLQPICVKMVFAHLMHTTVVDINHKDKDYNADRSYHTLRLPLEC